MAKNQLKAGSILSYIQMAVNVLISLLYTPVMMRLLGQSEYGLYNTVSSTISMLSILSLGFNAGYIRYYSKYKKLDDKQSIYKLNGLFLMIFTIIGIVAFLCGLFLSGNLTLVFDEGLTSQEYEIAKVLMLLLAINLATTFPMSVFSNIISANERFVFLKLLGIIKHVLGPLVTLPILLAGYRSIAMVTVTLAINVSVDICYFIYVVVVLKNKFVFRDFEKGLFRGVFAYTGFIALNMIVDQVNWNLGKFLLGRYSGTVAVAVYSAGYTLYQCYMMFSTHISGVFTPRIHRISNDTAGNELEQRRQFTALFVKIGRIQFLILALIATGVIFFGKPFIAVWAGEGYEDSYYVAVLLILSATIPLIQNIGIEIQRSLNRHKFRSLVYFAMAIINIGITAIACQKYGAVGAAIGTTISVVVANGLIMNIYYHKKCNINIVAFWKNILRQCLGLIIPLAVGIAIYKLINFTSVWVMLIWIAVYTVVYCISMFLLGTNKYERNLIIKPIRKGFLKIYNFFWGTTNAKNSFWQAVRGVAIIAVVLIHCQGTEETNTFDGIYYLLFRNIINFPVALFFFVSGFFTRYQAGGLKNFYKKKFIRLVVPFFVFSMAYLIFNIIGGKRYTVLEAITAIVTGKVATPFYYIIVLLMFVLITPIISKCLNSKVLSALVLLITPVITVVAYIVQNYMDVSVLLKYTPIWLSYFYLGLLLAKHKIRLNWKKVVVLLPITYVLQIAETILLNNFEKLSWLKFSQLKISGMLFSFSVILFVYALSERADKQRQYKLLQLIGDNSYGIFYLHTFFIIVINFIVKTLDFYIPLPIIQIIQLFVAIICSILSIIIIKLCFKDKLSKKIFGV